VVAFLPGEVVATYPALIRPVAGNSFVMGVLAVLCLEHILFRQAPSTAKGAGEAL
jgi:hypothetical protein